MRSSSPQSHSLPSSSSSSSHSRSSSSPRSILLLLSASLALLTLFSSNHAALAQITVSPSQDPLSGSTFTTPVYSPATTFTPTTTFDSAESPVPTSLVGSEGPSVTTNPYTYSYSAPTTTIQGTDLSNLYSSLAAIGKPTAATSSLQGDASNLQIVADAAVTLGFGGGVTASILAALSAMLMGGVMLL